MTALRSSHFCLFTTQGITTFDKYSTNVCKYSTIICIVEKCSIYLHKT